MNILVDHSVYWNLGDMGILQSSLSHLLANRPEASLYVKDSPVCRRWPCHPRVHPIQYELCHPALEFARRHLRRVRPLRRHLDISTVRFCHLCDSATLLRCRVRVSSDEQRTKTGTHRLDEWIRRFDALYIPGGSDLNDLFPLDAWHRCCLIAAFQRAGKAVVLTGQQIGPFFSNMTRRSVVNVLQNVQFLGIRDPALSVEALHKGGFTDGRFRITGDDTLGLTPAEPDEVESLLTRLNLKRGQFIAANIRVGPYAETVASHMPAFSHELAALSQRCGLPVVIVPISWDAGDSDVASGYSLRKYHAHAPSVVQDREMSPSLVRGLLGAALGAIGVSFHFGWFSLSEGVPAVSAFSGPYYAQKARSLAAFWEDPRIAFSLDRLYEPSHLDEILDFFHDASVRPRLMDRCAVATALWKRCAVQAADALLAVS